MPESLDLDDLRTIALAGLNSDSGDDEREALYLIAEQLGVERNEDTELYFFPS